jgi:hypothetical protein
MVERLTFLLMVPGLHFLTATSLVATLIFYAVNKIMVNLQFLQDLLEYKSHSTDGCADTAEWSLPAD